ncbi:type II toxin-antitoxin system RelE/ParE family toxin [Burkholderia sp. CCA53]|uniref:type II toxin-antitoxin system RelE family toxin n=1 Tax=Burkholderia sp. CCA53 TaxID=1776288 RepID=UPI0009F6C204|nr:type II toxin-antitoxin system RelE/ParE family toxin [Burkholderia sp. CCA53]
MKPLLGKASSLSIRCGERQRRRGHPRSIGEALKGSKLGEFWKYRVGEYRIIADIQDGALCILIVRVGNRREIYKR